jgi:hypothetical protein
MNKIINYFGQDGLLHIICSTILVSVINLAAPLWMAVVITAVIGIAKEIIYDKLLGKGTCDAKDLVADAVGIIIGCI